MFPESQHPLQHDEMYPSVTGVAFVVSEKLKQQAFFGEVQLLKISRVLAKANMGFTASGCSA